MNHKKTWKTLKEKGVPSYLTPEESVCREEAMVRIRHGTTDWFKVEKGVRQGCILSLCLFNIYAESIMWNSRLAESQARIKIVGRNISNLRYTGDCSHEIRRHLLLRIKAKTKPRQHITKQRHHFADKDPYSQNYSFSSSHVQMWELDLK